MPAIQQTRIRFPRRFPESFLERLKKNKIHTNTYTKYTHTHTTDEVVETCCQRELIARRLDRGRNARRRSLKSKREKNVVGIGSSSGGSFLNPPVLLFHLLVNRRSKIRGDNIRIRRPSEIRRSRTLSIREKKEWHRLEDGAAFDGIQNFEPLEAHSVSESRTSTHIETVRFPPRRSRTQLFVAFEEPQNHRDTDGMVECLTQSALRRRVLPC